MDQNSNLFQTNDAGHQYDKCSYWLSEEICNLVDDLPTLDGKLSAETKCVLLYIVGYVIRKDEQREDTYYFCENFGSYLDELNRGGLSKPGDTVVEWVFCSHIVFTVVVEQVCRISLANVLLNISELYNFNMERKHAFILSNILFKNHCNFNNPRSKTKNFEAKLLSLFLHWLFAGVLGLACWFLL